MFSKLFLFRCKYNCKNNYLIYKEVSILKQHICYFVKGLLTECINNNNCYITIYYYIMIIR